MPTDFRPATGLALALAASALTGCGPSDTGRDARVDARVDVANTINYGSFGTTAEIDCAAGKSLNIGGSNNSLKVVGSCGSVSIGGADNTITLERVDGELTVVGLNNRVVYRSGEPTVNDQGSGNRIGRG